MCVILFQMEIAKRLNAIIAQLLPFLSQEVGYIDLVGGILFSAKCDILYVYVKFVVIYHVGA